MTSATPASEKKLLAVAIVSDIHIYNGSSMDSGPSYIGTGTSERFGYEHPFTGAIELVTRENLQADILMCAGDIADKANPAAQMYGWKQLERLAKALKTDCYISTCGNHDVDSRYQYNDHDAKGSLQSLVPMFPGLSESQSDRFWSRNFVVVTFNEWRLLILNTAAYHGGGLTPAAEFEHGRISKNTLAAIKRTLGETNKKVLNILLCHHHPIKNDQIDLQDYSEMKNGDLLINVLGSGDFGDWLVIHGHKHFPRIWRAPGSNDAPIIFSAGSFAAKLSAPLSSNVRNQFYILELDLENISKMAQGVLGKFKAWDWIDRKGWQPAGQQSGLPHVGGFGCRSTPASIARKIRDYLSASKARFISGDEAYKNIPELNFVAPNDLERTARELESTHQTKMIVSQFGKIDQIGY